MRLHTFDKGTFPIRVFRKHYLATFFIETSEKYFGVHFLKPNTLPIATGDVKVNKKCSNLFFWNFM